MLVFSINVCDIQFSKLRKLDFQNEVHSFVQLDIVIVNSFKKIRIIAVPEIICKILKRPDFGNNLSRKIFIVLQDFFNRKNRKVSFCIKIQIFLSGYAYRKIEIIYFLKKL